MISIIICSINAKSCLSTTNSIKQTIGCEYETIIINNKYNKYNIFSAYNEGIKQAKGDILCFMHEDVLFHSNNWGERVYQHLSNNEIGIIGVFGGHYIPKMFPAAYVDGPCSGHFIQGHSNIDNYYTSIVDYHNYNGNSNRAECVVVDGMWFCGKKELFNRIHFDDKIFHGFHCYDLDICMQAQSIQKKVMVIFDILVEHKSTGAINQTYYDQLKLWYNKWDENLPIRRGVSTQAIPNSLMNPETFSTKLTLEKEYWKKLYEDIAYSKRYLFICKIMHILSVIRRS